MYKDSNYRLNSYHGFAWTPLEWDEKRWKAGLSPLLFTNYGPHLLPALLPTAIYERDVWGANLLWIPGKVFMMQIKLGF